MKYSKITSIKQAKNEDIYHLSVERNHNYYANNICVHNCYRGMAGVKLYNLSDKDYEVKKGDKIAQFVVYPLIPCEISEGEVEDTNRGDKGFGSSGR